MPTGTTTPKVNERRRSSASDIKQDIDQNNVKNDTKLDQKYDINGKPLPGSGYTGAIKKSQNNEVFRPKIPNAKNRNNRKATLHTQVPWVRGPMDVANKSIAPDITKFRAPDKPFVEAHSGKVKTGLSILSGGGAGWGSFVAATAIGSTIGGTFGSVVPVAGTVVGILVGAVVGRLVGHLIKRYGRSHSHRRHFQTAIDSLRQQGVKLTPKEEDRLRNMEPKHWEYLAKKGRPIIGKLRRSGAAHVDKRRWAKQVVYQFAALCVAKHGYALAQRMLNTISYDSLTIRGDQETIHGKSPDEIAKMVLANIEELGGDSFTIFKQSKNNRGTAELDDLRSEAKTNWGKLQKAFEDAFGTDLAKRFEKKYARQLELGTQYPIARPRLEAALVVKRKFRGRIEPYLDKYDEEIKNRLFKLGDKYAAEIALGDLDVDSVIDKNNNIIEKRIEEFINTADRLQRAEDRKKGSNKVDRIPPEILIRRATLPNRLSAYADVSNRYPSRVYKGFVNGAVDLYEECETLLKIPREQLSECLSRKGEKPDNVSKTLARNLRKLAELAKTLKNDGIDSGTARILLRMEAIERGAFAEKHSGDNDVWMGVRDGWSVGLADMGEKTLRPVFMDAAQRAVADAKSLHEALKNDPSLENLTIGDAEDAVFRFMSKNQDYDLSGCKVWKQLTENNFADLKTILKSRMDIGKTYENLRKGARTVEEAIDCTRMRVSAEKLVNIRKSPHKDKYKDWRDKGFTYLEIVAYRDSVSVYKTDDQTNPPVRYDTGRKIGPNDKRLNFLKGSGLTAGEANRLLWLDIVPETKTDPSPIELRHRSESKVLSEKHKGVGGHHQVVEREVMTQGGKIDTRVFKTIPGPTKPQEQEATKRLVGSNLGASMINEELGFGAIVHTQLSVRKAEIGVSMEVAKGHTARDLQKGDVFLPVPQDESHYERLCDRVKDDLEALGAISEETRKFALEEYGFTRLRMVGQELQAAGDFMGDLVNDAEFQRMTAELQIIDFLTDELDRHRSNFMIDVRLGPNGAATAFAVKGIDNDGGFAAKRYFPTSLRKPPRVISRRQAEALKKMYQNRKDEKNGILARLKQVVAPSRMYEPLKPKIASEFPDAYDPAGAGLKPGRRGDQVSLFDKRLELLVSRIEAAESGSSKVFADGQPALRIIEEDDMNSEVKVDLNEAPKKGGAGWGSDEVTKLLKNSPSIVATCDGLQTT